MSFCFQSIAHLGRLSKVRSRWTDVHFPMNSPKTMIITWGLKLVISDGTWELNVCQGGRLIDGTYDFQFRDWLISMSSCSYTQSILGTAGLKLWHGTVNSFAPAGNNANPIYANSSILEGPYMERSSDNKDASTTIIIHGLTPRIELW